MQPDLKGKSVILGVTGSIAAVKAPMIARELVRVGAAVTCVMTGSAEEFMRREEMEVATGNSVVTRIFTEGSRAGSTDLRDPELRKELTWHVHLARSADAMLIAPCSASAIGMLRVGIYDNAVTLAAASLPKGTPLIIVPAMDEDMWLQPAVAENIEWLRAHGVFIVEPVLGRLASGLTGMGRMPEPEEVVEKFGFLIGQGGEGRARGADPSASSGQALRAEGAMRGKRVLITGGPTYEPIDAVRFIGNRSSGKMAAALAMEANNRGAEVTLVMGPSSLTLPSPNGRGIRRIDVETAEEMLNAVKAEAPNADIIIMSAAVADFAPELMAEGKLKKGSEETMTLTLKKNPDILAEIARSKKPEQIIVGFALEKGDNAENYAKKKLEEKNLDMIVLNNLQDPGAGFGHDTNKISIFSKNGESESFPLMSKEECAKIILDHLY